MYEKLDRKNDRKKYFSKIFIFANKLTVIPRSYLCILKRRIYLISYKKNCYPKVNTKPIKTGQIDRFQKFLK